ncbi:uncharacterized protein [Triticum aestivum]|uniref:uncharacterized protein isoform X1 n=1 Tax=Triticum aestivum TaxID=4565 RepID=UPI001D01849D|nr:uncharacterized protein LOC123121835 isoform X1 [Triticum aestivum]
MGGSSLIPFDPPEPTRLRTLVEGLRESLDRAHAASHGGEEPRRRIFNAAATEGKSPAAATEGRSPAGERRSPTPPPDSTRRRRYSSRILVFSPVEHEATDQERRERKIKNSHPEQGTVRMLSREEWDEIQEVRPRTPFESKLARPHARLRTGEKVRLEDAKDWAVDVLTDAFTRAEESAKRK